MKYDNSQVRRQDRLMDEEAARQLLREGEYAVLSMVDEDGAAYGIPVSYAWDGEDALYIHCAPEGRKLSCLAHSPRVSMTVVGHTHVIARKFTTNYSSVVITGTARTGLDEEERMAALRLIIGKYAPQHQEVGEKYARGSFHRTEIIRVDIHTMSGKRKAVSD